MAWLIVVAAAVHFVWLVLWKYVHVDADAYSIFWSRREWLWAHLAGGTATVLLGPTQFVARFRRAYPLVHRWTGRVYLIALLVGSVGATGLIATSPAGSGLQLAFALTELAWLFTALMGFKAIRQKRPQAHRRWMLRNYIVTFTFVTFRGVVLIPGVMELASPAIVIPVLLLVSWITPLLVHEIFRSVCERHRNLATIPPDDSPFPSVR